MAQKFEYTVLDLIENAAKSVKTSPLNLGGVAGVGGGVGGPPGGFIGWLPQTRVAYDYDELAYSGIVTNSGLGTLVDNLAHIRYRLNTIESGGSGGSPLTVDDWDGSPVITNTTHLTFSGGTVIDLGGGHALVVVGSGGGGGSSYLSTLLDVSISGVQNGDILVYSGGASKWVNVQPLDDVPTDNIIYGRRNQQWVAVSGITTSGGSPLTVEQYGGSPSVNNVDKIIFSGVIVSDLGSGDVLIQVNNPEPVLHRYNEICSGIPGRYFYTQYTYASGTLRVYYNGVRQVKGIHYIDDTDFTVFSTYFDTYNGDYVIIDYDYLASSQISVDALVDSDGILLVDSDGIQLV